MEEINKNAEQSQDEFVSGDQGKGAANDSYDGGNRGEQPDASATNANNPPQEPKLDGQSFTNVPQQAAASTVDSNASTKGDDQKLREFDLTDVDENVQKQAHQGRRDTAAIMKDHGVSKETLKGPQGPAPHPASDFVKEGKKEMKAEQPAGSKGEDSKDSEAVSQSNEKQGIMSKMKERLTNIAHPHHRKYPR